MNGDLLRGILGNSALAFVIVNLVLAGSAAWVTGKAIAIGWKPLTHALAYCLLLALGTRFVLFALFGAKLSSLPGLVVALGILLTIGALSFRVNQVRKMIVQYPWLYERAGLLGWRSRQSASGGGG